MPIPFDVFNQESREVKPGTPLYRRSVMHREKILITGISGSGKSYSLRNLPAEETLFVRPTSKMPMPVKGIGKKFTPMSDDRKTGNLITLNEPLYQDPSTGENVSKIPIIYATAKQRGFKYVVIDDVQYILLAIENMFKGTGEYKDARRIYAFIKQFTYSMFSMADMEATNITSIFSWQKLGTKDELVIPGEAFNEVIVPQGFFNVVLQAEAGITGDRFFRTNGIGLCKSPADMLGETIPNDIMPVLTAINEYFN